MLRITPDHFTEQKLRLTLELTGESAAEFLRYSQKYSEIYGEEISLPLLARELVSDAIRQDKQFQKAKKAGPISKVGASSIPVQGSAPGRSMETTLSGGKT